jgi:hypothetical protein
MKPLTQCILVTVSLIILAFAVLRPQETKTKEPFVAELEQVGIGVGAGVGVLLLLVGLFFVFYNVPKEPNVIPRRSMYYYNLE